MAQLNYIIHDFDEQEKSEIQSVSGCRMPFKESIRLFVISGRLITRKMPSDARTGEKRFPAGAEKHLSVQIQDKIHLTLYRQVFSGSP